MKNIVLKVPTAIFVVMVILPFMIYALQLFSEEELLEPKYYGVLSNIGSVVLFTWLFSIVDYFQSKTSDFKHTRLIHFLLIFTVLIKLIVSLSLHNLGGVYGMILHSLHYTLYVTAAVFIILLVRKVFYERAVWFIVIEIIFPIIGITTLTPEIKRNESEILSQDL